jgi:regulator of protease activity HflC (stomatin/prohibitin superfamily)
MNNSGKLSMREIPMTAVSGLKFLLWDLLAMIGAGAVLVFGIILAESQQGVLGGLLIVAALLMGFTAFICLFGFFIVNPNEGRVVQLFGDYRGTVRDPGLKFANPFYTKQRVSLRVRNFESARLKVNDQDGNPIEIAAVVVWRVIDTAEAVFHVDDYEHFVKVQSESALRNLATHYHYDSHDNAEISLRGSTDVIAEKLKSEIQNRLTQAGVDVIEARISHLAYAPEIAGVMLQRQQASAVIAARQKIVEGAVGMVEMALEMLSTKKLVQLDEQRKAAMVSNLLVVLCSDRATQPIVSAGTEP